MTNPNLHPKKNQQHDHHQQHPLNITTKINKKLKIKHKIILIQNNHNEIQTIIIITTYIESHQTNHTNYSKPKKYHLNNQIK